jgi:hypothetical protein
MNVARGLLEIPETTQTALCCGPSVEIETSEEVVQ